MIIGNNYLTVVRFCTMLCKICKKIQINRIIKCFHGNKTAKIGKFENREIYG